MASYIRWLRRWDVSCHKIFVNIDSALVVYYLIGKKYETLVKVHDRHFKRG
jgi:hypothetical protein